MFVFSTKKATETGNLEANMAQFNELTFARNSSAQAVADFIARTRVRGEAANAPVLDATRLEFWLTASCVDVDFAGALRLRVDDNGLRLERTSLQNGEILTRYWRGEVRHLRVLCDRSSVEIFINEGEGVMSSRYFPAANATLGFEGDAHLRLRYWSLRACMVE